MENKKEILLIAQKLTELRLKQKMLKWAFENSKGLPEEKMKKSKNSPLGRKEGAKKICL